MINKVPHVFISYSWTTENFQQKVKEFATQLVHDGVDVKLDIWDLKDGQDKYVFMEQCVTDPEIDRVLIICDRGYALKADKRQGGVGDETAIISAEIYNNAKQEKFIPVVVEKDKNGNPYMPAYLKSRMYQDLTGEKYSKGYEALLRNIYEEPLERKPELGSRPAWLDNVAQTATFFDKSEVREQRYIPVIGQEDVGNVPLEAAFLLVYAAAGTGEISRIKRISSPIEIAVDGKQFLADNSRRESARWQEALDWLYNRGWVKAVERNGVKFEVTGMGYRKADWLKAGMQINTELEPLEELKSFGY